VWSSILQFACAVALGLVAEVAAAATPRLEGQWAGDHVRLVLDGNGGQLQMACANGTITMPLKWMTDSRFSAKGSFEQHRPGPQFADVVAPVQAAQFLGDIQDGVMSLSIQASASAPPQRVHLRQDASIMLICCL
jgi:hypothetical protein